MITTLLTHKSRKDIIRKNKKINHRQYLGALPPGPKLKYWAGYHKKKLIFFALVGVIAWTYDFHISIKNYVLSIRSPRQMLSHMLLGEEKLQKTVNEQRIIGWQYEENTLDLLTKLYYETDKRLIFGVGRNYLFQVYSNMGLLQKPEDVNNFWIGGGFHRKRNQLVSGVSYKQFISLYSEGYKTLLKTNPELTQQEYLKNFMTVFVQKGPQIVAWQKDFNRKRYSEYLKNLVSDHEKKTDEINTIMKEELDISQEALDKKIEKMGMKGIGIKDKWVYWRNREILTSLREYTLHNKLNLNILEGKERYELEKRLKDIERQLANITAKKQSLRNEHKAIYDEDLL